MAIKVVAKYIPLSPRKVRLVANLFKSRKVNDALTYLEFEKKYAAQPIRKLIKSAVSAAEDKKNGWRSSNNKRNKS